MDLPHENPRSDWDRLMRVPLDTAAADKCPECGEPKLHSEHFGEWACSDPECVMAHGSAPGGGHDEGQWQR